jgi:glyoxylase-like metal-dependent hydrolase (beta-lactamase superfamily II)
MLPDFKRVIDLEHGRMRLQFTRRPAFPAVFDNQRTDQGLDGDVAYNVAAGALGGAGAGRAGAPTGAGGGRGEPTAAGGPAPAAPARNRAGAQAAIDRRVEMLHHPLTALRAALDPAARVTNLRQSGSSQLVDVVTARGDAFTLAIDSLSKRPVSVTTMVDQPNLGDVARVTTFSGFEDVNGVQLPKHLVTTIDRFVEFDIGVMKNTLDADAADLAAPDAVRNAAPPAPAQNVVVTDVAKGIWFLTGGGVPSMVVEFADHVSLVEVPTSEARTLAVIAKAKELVPSKPLTQAIVTHHHFDHTGGLRTAVANGLTIVTQRVNEAWFRELMQRKHTIAPDELAKKPRPLKLVTFDDTFTLKDATMEVELVHLVGATHGDGMLAVYFPRERVYAEPDVWNPGAAIQPHLRSLYADITRRKLVIDRIVPMHGTAIQPYSEFQKVVEQWTGMK